jgi:nicotinate-nucleotide adenylyltransferase
MGEQLALEKVFLVPAGTPPHKSQGPVASFDQRIAMARLAVGDSDLLEVLDLEGKRPGLSYSIETLREFRALFGPETDLFFILGTDAFYDIRTWKEYERLFDHAHFVVIHRPGFSAHGFEPFLSSLGIGMRKTDVSGVYRLSSGKSVILKKATLMDISSTRIREILGAGRSVRYLVPEAVRTFIIQKGLYRKHGNPRKGESVPEHRERA